MEAGQDPSGLKSESNVFRYRPIGEVALWAGPGVDDTLVAAARAASAAVGNVVRVVGDPGERPSAGKLRMLGEVTDADRIAASNAGLWVDDAPVAADPTVELLHWVREQVVSESRHRHGNVTGRRPGLLGS
jgi:RHH-type proline utilization regulon transcriptional repressor/proline dehydrogenase/delta 1-pyrroline-5-carboxylate dehydrogenase